MESFSGTVTFARLTVIVKLTPTSVAPERPKLNTYVREIFQAILIRCNNTTYQAIMEDETRHQLISVAFGDGAFYCHVKESIAMNILPPFITHVKKMRIEATDGTLITGDIVDGSMEPVEELCVPATQRSTV